MKKSKRFFKFSSETSGSNKSDFEPIIKMEDCFYQKRGAGYRKFRLTSEKVIVESKTIRKYNKFEVKLNQLGTDIQYQADNTRPGKIFLIISLLWVAGSVLAYFLTKGKEDSSTWLLNAAIGAIVGCFSLLKKSEDDIFLTGGTTHLVFYRDIPSEEEVLDFIAKILNVRKENLKKEFTFYDKYTSEPEFYSRIKWLLDSDIISLHEYEDLKDEFNQEKLL